MTNFGLGRRLEKHSFDYDDFYRCLIEEDLLKQFWKDDYQHMNKKEQTMLTPDDPASISVEETPSARSQMTKEFLINLSALETSIGEIYDQLIDGLNQMQQEGVDDTFHITNTKDKIAKVYSQVQEWKSKKQEELSLTSRQTP